MSKRILMAVLLLAALSLSACCKPALVGSLPVQLHPQETGMWCWAASGQMIMDYLGRDVSQCTQANLRFNRSDCPCTQCTSPVSNPPCVWGGWPEFDKYGFTFKRTTNAALTWEQLREQISNQPNCKRRPFAFTWHWPGGGGHMMVAKGYLTMEGANYVVMLDPWAPCRGDERIITYDYYVESPGHHTHWDDFYDITYTGGM